MARTGLRTLAELTTLHVGGAISDLVEAASPEELIEAIRSADTQGREVLVLGGGSNLLAADAPFEGVVVRDGRNEIDARGGDAVRGEGDLVAVTATAGTPWDALVAQTVDRGLSGLEALSGIPGTVGAAPVQNVGAYGHDVADTLIAVRAWDRGIGEVVTLSAAELELGYRASLIKASTHEGDASGVVWGPTGRWVVLEATFGLQCSQESAPVLYGELARRLGVEVGERASARAVRDAVLELRHSKGMVLDPSDHDTWSAGSFFTNPILSADAARELLPKDAPRFPAGDGGRAHVGDEAGAGGIREERVKTSAAWLINHAGFTKGWALGEGASASLSTKHVLALTNRGGASSADIVELARAVRGGVLETFGIELVPEPVTVGLTL